MQMEIPEQAAWILARLRENGHEAYIVGGCVRDTLLGRRPEDWDITTSARPDEVKGVFGHTIDTGLKHGTVTVMREHVGYEVTTYRIDGEYEDGRHPKEVSFTRDLKEDLKRRDFTINAMAYNPEEGLVDIFGGRQDLEDGIIRCVGNAMERFTEDALRILRAIRFAAQLNFTIEGETKKALYAIAPNLARVSRERIQAELTKTLLSPHPERIRMVQETGMSPYISDSFPKAFAGRSEEGKTASHAETARLPADKAARWAAFLLDAGEAAGVQILRELKLDNDTISRTKTLIRWLPEEIPEEPFAIRRIMSAMEDGLFDLLLQMKQALEPYRAEHVKRIKALAGQIRLRGDCIRLRDMAVTGKDLIAAGFRPGPALGKTLNMLFSHVLEYPEDNEKETLVKKAKGWHRRHLSPQTLKTPR